MKLYLFLALSLACSTAIGQTKSKKPLDHSVYDGWQSVSSEAITNDAKWVLYAVLPQEGDAELLVKELKTGAATRIPRVNAAEFTNDSKYAVFLIKPFFKDTREAKIKKKRPDELPKDTLGVLTLGGALKKLPGVKSYKLPEEGSGLLAYLKIPADTGRRAAPSTGAAPAGAAGGRGAGRAGATSGAGAARDSSGADLVLINLASGTEKTFKTITDYAFSKNGKTLLLVSSGAPRDTTNLPGVFLYNTVSGTSKKISSGKGNYKNMAFDESGTMVAFAAEKNPPKVQQKLYQLYYYGPKQDSAVVVADQATAGMPKAWTVSPEARLLFSKDGKKLYFGTAPIAALKDTTIVDFEVAKVDIWNYKDDYLQPQQLRNLDRDLRKSYQAVIQLSDASKITLLADEKVPDLSLGQRGNSAFALGSTDYGNRVESQWTGSTARDLYLVSTTDGVRKKIASGVRGTSLLSPSGNYVVWYNRTDKSWYSYSIKTGKQIALNALLKESFYDEENDVPDDPAPYGIAGFLEGDRGVLINDHYDIWKFDLNTGAAENITNGVGRTNKITLRYTDFKRRAGGFGGFRGSGGDEDDAIKDKQVIYLKAFNNVTKESGWYKKTLGSKSVPVQLVMSPHSFSAPVIAKNAPVFIYEKSSYTASPDLYVSSDFKKETKLSAINAQQANYNWGTAELVHWTTPKGYTSDGILYKPEDFDPNKKYPMIVYFYEKVSDGLYAYNAPAPTPSRINISYFVSNGYLVFTPDIAYEIGQPGPSAMEFINSGVEALKKNAWVDAKKIGLQGQSWGGYQVAYLITQTDMYAAAWAGAPVANMTSAYGGIRWETGMNRQFQYEKTQSRIGATLWEKPDLYIANSPLFHLPKVKTPLMIMANDADGAVPWYQGIELFTGLRRLNKPVWLLNYNGEAHNLVQRQNRKDIQRREQQFFDHYLKGKPMPAWMEKGVPATEKGRNWGWEEIVPATTTSEAGK